MTQPTPIRQLDRAQRLALLKAINIGKRIAEEESRELQSYFLGTVAWERLTSNAVDVVFGSKGFGKSALYILLLDNKDKFEKQAKYVIQGEKPAGTAVFAALKKQRPALTEPDLLLFWKAFILAVAGARLQELNLSGGAPTVKKLQTMGLIPYEGLGGALNKAVDWCRRLPGRVEIEAESEFGPEGMPKQSVKGHLRKPESESVSATEELDKLLTTINQICEDNRTEFWVALDRLDVAFEEELELESRALRALFRTYSDMRAFRNFRLKIFIRDDLWNRITTERGFREASHIVRTLTLDWDEESLLNLIVRRLIANESVRNWLDIKNPDEILSDLAQQREVFYKLFPDQVEAGKKRRKTWEWILTRIQDGKEHVAPRELVHLADAARLNKIKYLERGQGLTPSLISPAAIQEALIEVSKAKLELGIYQEYPNLKPHLERLRKNKTEHSIKSLVRLFNVSPAEADTVIKQLVSLGILSAREGGTFWMPFLYRPALDLTRGLSAE